MFGRSAYYFQDSLGQTYAFSVWPLADSNNHPRQEAVTPSKVYAKQTFASIVSAFRDPFHYDLLDLWLEVYQRPWARPRSLHQLIDELSDKIASGELKAYLVDSPVWKKHNSGAVGEGGAAGSGGGSGGADAIRSQGSSASGSAGSSSAIAGTAGTAAVTALSLADRKGVPPTSLEDAVNRLKSMGDEIARDGYKPKYSDDELLDMAETGNVASERYHVRFMESGYLTRDGKPGMLGAPLEGKTGNGAKYWSTTFDQIEDSDTDPELLCGKVGLDYDPAKEYALVVIDAEAAKPLTGVASVPATFANVSEFANRELPDKFPKEFTDQTMNEEFQAQYAEHHQAAVDEGFLKNEWSSDHKKFGDYLDAHGVEDSEKELHVRRMKMHGAVGNNQYYEGNGLTKDTISASPNQYGAVETLNFERSKVDLEQLKDGDAIAAPIILKKKA